MLRLLLSLMLLFGLTACGAGGTEAAVSADLQPLQDAINHQNCVLGTAYLGSYNDGVSDAYAEAYPFLLSATLVDAGGDELYAFVPASNNTALTVCSAEITADGTYRNTETLCQGKKGEVLLVRCNVSDLSSNVCIAAQGKSFHPTLSLMDGGLAIEDGCFDFTLEDDPDIRMATNLLCEAAEVQQDLSCGMTVQYTGEKQVVDGRECWLFVLGTEHDGQFVRKRYYAVCDNLIYKYDAVTDRWTSLGG
jgi:hypothetical protein